MPEEINGHDVIWWKMQWDAMKAENDRINPALDAVRLELATASQRLSDIQIKLRDAQDEIRRLKGQSPTDNLTLTRTPAK